MLVCKYRFKSNMPQTESKRTLLKNSISSDWKGSSSNHRAHRPMRSNRTVYRAGTFVLHSLPALSALNPQTLCTFKLCTLDTISTKDHFEKRPFYINESTKNCVRL